MPNFSGNTAINNTQIKQSYLNGIKNYSGDISLVFLRYGSFNSVRNFAGNNPNGSSSAVVRTVGQLYP
ncbi:hypothetical protein JYQ62_22150 [Nostoc sp. UHCC 0702]|nr:hypothetical protein JYQ62_22150 [Nostoc sp. UHCC 0702]